MNKVVKISSICLIFIIAVLTTSFFITETLSVPISVSALRKGDRGSEVKSLQQKLKDKGYSVGKVDGIYGSQTVSAVKKYQKATGLQVDGIAGPATLKKLGLAGSNSGSSSSDVYLLAKVVYAEARGEPYVGKVAVAAVVLNRVKSSKFPNTLAGVVYQPWAFTAVNDGQINLSPDDSAMKAAKDALNGYDPTYGCIYYYNPAVATNQWIFSRKIIVTIGRHRFCV